MLVHGFALALAELVVYLAAAPKSNAVYAAYGEASRDALETRAEPVPLWIRNAPTRLMKDLGYGQGYAYDHDAPERFSGQNYFPDGMARPTFYRPTEEGEEALIRQKLESWAKLRQARGEAT